MNVLRCFHGPSKLPKASLGRPCVLLQNVLAKWAGSGVDLVPARRSLGALGHHQRGPWVALGGLLGSLWGRLGLLECPGGDRVALGGLVGCLWGRWGGPWGTFGAPGGFLGVAVRSLEGL